MVIINIDDNDNNSKQMDKLTRIHPISYIYIICVKMMNQKVWGAEMEPYSYMLYEKIQFPKLIKQKLK